MVQSTRRKKRKKIRPIFWVLLLMAGGIGFGWWLWHGINAPTHRFNYMVLSVDGELQKILPGEEILLSPTQTIKIEEISTTVPFNFGVRIAARGIDAPALKYEEKEIYSLLPGQEKFDRYSFRVQVNHRDKELGYTTWKVRPFVEDWLARANRIIDKEQRLSFLEKAVSTMPEEDELKRRLINEYKDLKRWKQAASMLEDIAQDEKDRKILMELLEVYTSMGSQSEIISVLKRILELDPGDLEIRQKLATIYEKTGNKKSAIHHYEVMLKYVEGKDALPVYTSLGYLYAQIGKEQESIRYYLKAKELNPKDGNLYYNLYTLYKNTGNEDKANRYLAKALELSPGDIEGRIELAQSLLEKNELDDAKRYLKEALKKKPESIEALLLMSSVLDEMGDQQELKKIYKKIISLKPKNGAVIYNLASLEYESGNLVESLKYFKKYIALNPKDENAHRMVFDIYREMGEEESAYEQCLELINLRPSDIELYRYAFEYLREKDEYNEMILLMEKGINAGAGNTELRQYLILAYLNSGKKAQAEKQMEHLLKARPKDTELWLKLARLRESLDDLKGAIEAYKAVLELKPDHEEAGEAYLRLRLKSVKGGDEG